MEKKFCYCVGVIKTINCDYSGILNLLIFEKILSCKDFGVNLPLRLTQIAI